MLRTEITKTHLNNHICQHRGMKISTVTPSFYYVFNISLYCNDTIPSFIGNLWRVLLLGNHLKCGLFYFAYDNHAKKFGSNFNQEFSFLSKSNSVKKFICVRHNALRVLMSLGHKNLILLLAMRSCNEHEKMPTWGILNASVLLDEHGHLPFYFKIEVLI